MLRTLHLYLGTLFAPLIVFFSFSGILQTIGLHEAEDPAAARPAAWIVAIASLHKEQHLPVPKPQRDGGALADMRAGGVQQDHHAAESPPGGAGAAHAEPEQDVTQTILKAFVLLMGIGLIVSALLGIAIALKNARTRRVSILMLMAGTILPMVLMIR